MSTASRIVTQIEADGALEIVPLELPAPRRHEVLVEIFATGVCQSQVFWMHQPRRQPILFGHEGYGVVRAVGDGVNEIREGQYVLVTWLPRTSAEGRRPVRAQAELPDGRVGWSPNVYTWADHTLVDELYLYPLPGPVDPDLCVAGCAVLTGAGAVSRAPVEVQGKHVAVIGAGGVGLCAVTAARAGGAERIIALDLLDDKLALATQFGATDTLNSLDLDPDAVVRELGGDGCDLVVDCVTSGPTVRQAIALTRGPTDEAPRGGVTLLVGLPKGPQELDLSSVVFGQKTVMGTLAGGSVQNDLDTYIRWQEDGILDYGQLVTDRYEFDDVQNAVDDLVAGRVRGRSVLLRHS